MSFVFTIKKEVIGARALAVMVLREVQGRVTAGRGILRLFSEHFKAQA